MKIAILYICTGKYDIFWKDFYLSCEKNFIKEAEKEYFVFTDAPKIEFESESKNIRKIYQENLGWPNNTLMRYDIFLKAQDQIASFDYCFFFNANLIFMKPIAAAEFLPHNQQKLVACLHPGFYNKPKNKLPYDRNKNSLAYIPYGSENNYFQGAINGGITSEFIKAMKELDGNIKKDLENNIVATWHDESHWNKFLLGRTDVKILTPSYLYPEGQDLPFEKKILMIDKSKYGGHDNMRGTKGGIYKKIKNFVGKFI